jgi:hypothetical protein
MNSWARDPAIIEAAFRRIVEATPDDYAIVMSLQRTGSKFLTWTLRGAWGARSGLHPKGAGAPDPNFVPHCHGISDRRLLDTLPEPQGQSLADLSRSIDKARNALIVRQRLSAADHVTVFTILRDPFQRFVSHFALRKAKLKEAPDDVLREAMTEMRRDHNRDATAWESENLGAFFDAPPLTAVDDWACYRSNKATLIALRLEHLNVILDDYLYRLIGLDEIKARRDSLGMGEARPPSNSLAHYGLTEFRRRVERLAACSA